MFGVLARRGPMPLSLLCDQPKHIETEGDLEDIMIIAKIHNTNQIVNDEPSACASFSSLVNNMGEECVDSGPCNDNGTKVNESLE